MRVMAVHGKGIQGRIEEVQEDCKRAYYRKIEEQSRREMKELGIAGKIERDLEGVGKGMGQKSLISSILESFPCGSVGKLGQWSAFFQSLDFTKIPDISRPSIFNPS
jgi:hypothetical protein